jgi:Chitobiase/beta-hexosaminidase C-terminal domain
MSAVLLQVQEDCLGRLLAAEQVNEVAIFLMRKAQTEEEIAGLLRTLKGRSGKIGACIMVQMPVIDVVSPNLPGPSTAITQSFLVIEHPTLNAGSQGTGKSAEYLAEETLRLFHHFTPYGVTQVFVGGQNAIVPLELEGMRAYTVTLTTTVQLTIPAKVVRPVIAPSVPAAPSMITLSTATAGAAIHYTIDGSYPSAANPTALLYTVPFPQATAATIRTAASKAGMQQSDIAQVNIS